MALKPFLRSSCHVTLKRLFQKFIGLSVPRTNMFSGLAICLEKRDDQQTSDRKEECNYILVERGE